MDYAPPHFPGPLPCLRAPHSPGMGAAPHWVPRSAAAAAPAVALGRGGGGCRRDLMGAWGPPHRRCPVGRTARSQGLLFPSGAAPLLPERRSPVAVPPKRAGEQRQPSGSKRERGDRRHPRGSERRARVAPFPGSLRPPRRPGGAAPAHRVGARAGRPSACTRSGRWNRGVATHRGCQVSGWLGDRGVVPPRPPASRPWGRVACFFAAAALSSAPCMPRLSSPLALAGSSRRTALATQRWAE